MSNLFLFSGSRIQIQIRIKIYPGSGSALRLMRIRNTAKNKRSLKVHWHEISEVIDFLFFALNWIKMVKSPAWDRKFFIWPNRVWARFVMRILSTCAGHSLFHTEYTQDVVFFILSMRRKALWTIRSMNWKQILILARQNNLSLILREFLSKNI